MENLKKLVCLLASCLLIIGLTNHVNAADTQETQIIKFKEKIIETNLYKEFSSQIKGIYAENVNENNQITVAYALDENENPDHTLLFTGNDLYELEQVLEVTVTNENISVLNLLEDTRTRAHLGYCVDHQCTKTSYIQKSTGKCPPLIGQTCTPLQYVPNYGMYLRLLCQGGIWAYCNLDINKKCVAWKTEEYECSIP